MSVDIPLVCGPDVFTSSMIFEQALGSKLTAGQASLSDTFCKRVPASRSWSGVCAQAGPEMTKGRDEKEMYLLVGQRRTFASFLPARGFWKGQSAGSGLCQH